MKTSILLSVMCQKKEIFYAKGNYNWGANILISGSLIRRLLAIPAPLNLRVPCWGMELEQDTTPAGREPRTQICRDT